jgi:hypothetical protein
LSQLLLGLPDAIEEAIQVAIEGKAQLGLVGLCVASVWQWVEEHEELFASQLVNGF